MGGMFDNTPVYEPLDVGTEMVAGASWGTAVPDTMQSIPGGEREGTAGKTIGSNGEERRLSTRHTVCLLQHPALALSCPPFNFPAQVCPWET